MTSVCVSVDICDKLHKVEICGLMVVLGCNPFLWCFNDFPLNLRLSLIFMHMQITLLVNIVTRAFKGDIKLHYTQNISDTIHTDHFSFVCQFH